MFEAGLNLMESYCVGYGDLNGAKEPSNLSDITIDGALFDKPKYNFKKLKDGDLRGLMLGELTDCCQHLGDNGAECAQHGFLSPHGAFYVVAEKETDQIVAQSWAWQGKNGEVVFDSLESLKGHMDTAKWSALLENLAGEFQKNADIPAFLVGTDGDTPEDLPYGTAPKKQLAEPIDYDGYRDSKEGQYVVYKR